MGEHWSREEVEALVADYLAMLELELRGERFNKTAHRRALASLLRDRSDGSIERKRQNVSAILIQLNHAYIDGYKPLPNVQGLLREVVVDRLASDQTLAKVVAASAAADAHVPTVDDLLGRWEEPPEPVAPFVYARAAGEKRERHGRFVDYAEMESRNTRLGRAGELFALNYERARLIHAGKDSLADAIDHVAFTRGDGLGFDIRSFETDGKDRFIEVKTTSAGKYAAFHVTANEVEVSRELDNSFHLYRIFRFRDDPRLFGLGGPIERSCRLQPTQFAARVK